MLAAQGSTLGQYYKNISDEVVQRTWDNDIGTRTCYLYPYWLDNEPDLREGMSRFDESNKYKVDLRVVIKSYKSIAKDDGEIHLVFPPDIWNSCELPEWWSDNMHVDYNGFGIDYPISLYADVPNDRGIYERWLIVYREYGNQFVKNGALKCNTRLQWVTDTANKRYIREMWCVQRTQNSYNSGIYQYQKMLVLENQSKLYLPYNDISNELYYNQRLALSLPAQKPLVWDVSKIENTVPRGVLNVTLYQDEWNANSDVWWKPDDEGNPLPGQYTYLCDYYQSPAVPVVEPTSDVETGDTLSLTCGSEQIYIGRSKVITATCLDENGADVTGDYSNFEWTYEIDGEDAASVVSETALSTANKIRITFTGDELYAFKPLTIGCVASKGDGSSTVTSINLGILA